MNHTLIITVAAIAVAGCNRQERVIVEVPAPTPLPIARTETFETHALQKEIDVYDRDPSVAQGARVKKAFAEINGEIAELEEHVARKSGGERAEAVRKLADLRAYRDGERVRFVGLEAKVKLEGPRRDVVEVPAIRQPDGGAEKAGEKIDDAARKVQESLKDAADAIRDRGR